MSIERIILQNTTCNQCPFSPAVTGCQDGVKVYKVNEIGANLHGRVLKWENGSKEWVDKTIARCPNRLPTPVRISYGDAG